MNAHRARVRAIENPDGTAQYLYVMEDPARLGLVKIGASKGPETRRRALACASPGIVVAASWAVPDMMAAESAMHRVFRPDGAGREWFYATAGEVTFAHESVTNGATVGDVRRVIEAARSVRGGDAPKFVAPRGHVEDFGDMRGQWEREFVDGPDGIPKGAEPYAPGSGRATEWWGENMHLLEPQQ